MNSVPVQKKQSVTRQKRAESQTRSPFSFRSKTKKKTKDQLEDPTFLGVTMLNLFVAQGFCDKKSAHKQISSLQI